MNRSTSDLEVTLAKPLLGSWWAAHRALLKAAQKLRIEANKNKLAISCRIHWTTSRKVCYEGLCHFPVQTFLVSTLWGLLMCLVGGIVLILFTAIVLFRFLCKGENHQAALLLHALRNAMAHYTLISLWLNVCPDHSLTFSHKWVILKYLSIFSLKYRLQLICSQHPCLINYLFHNNNTVVVDLVKQQPICVAYDQKRKIRL